MIGKIHITSGKDTQSLQYGQINWQLFYVFTFIYEFLTMKIKIDVGCHCIVCQQSHEERVCVDGSKAYA